MSNNLSDSRKIKFSMAVKWAVVIIFFIMTSYFIFEMKDATALHADAVSVELDTAKQTPEVSDGNRGGLSDKPLNENVVKTTNKGELTFAEAENGRIEDSPLAAETTSAPQPLASAISVNRKETNDNAERVSSNTLPLLVTENSSAQQSEGNTRNDNPPLTSMLEQLGPTLSQAPLSQQLSSKAVGAVNSQASQQIEQLLSFSDAKARASINTGIDGRSRFEFGLDYLYPWLEGDNYTLFSQLSSHRWNERNQFNLGLGYRYSINDNLIVGTNAFFDQDITRRHNRLGLGFEVWGETIRSSFNYYLPLSGWKKSNDTQFNPDPLHYGLYERAARGWDINLEALILRPLAVKLTGFHWYGKDVDVLGTRSRVSADPYGLTLGFNWQPVSLLGFTLEETLMTGQPHDLKIGMNFTWNFDQSLQQQLDPQKGQAMSALSLSRHDFVTRNNNIVLQYKREELFRPLYFSPDRLTVKAGAAQSVNLAKGGYGGAIKYTSDQNEIVKVELDSGFITPLKRGETTIRAQEFQQGWWQTPVNNAFYQVTVLPGDIAPAAKQVNITGTPDVGETLAASYLFVNNEGNDEIDGGSPVVWFNENDSATSLSEGLTYKVRAEDRGQNIIFQVTPINKDNISGESVKQTVNIPSLKLSNLLIANGNTSVESDEVIIFPQGTSGQLFLTAIVKDRYDRPASMAPVFWSQLNSALGTITKRTGVTDDHGEMIIRYEGITTPGHDTVTVSLQPNTVDAASSISAKKSLSRNINVEFSAAKIDPLPGITLYVGENKTVSPTGGIIGEEYLFTSKSAEIVAIEQGKLIAKKVGVTEITVYQKPTATVNAPEPITFTVTVTKHIPEELQVKSVTVDFGAPVQTLDVSGGNGGELSYKSADVKIVSVSTTGELTFLKAGTTRITVSQPATENTAAPQPIDVAVTVNKIVGVALEVSPMKLKVGDKKGVMASGGNGGQGGKLTYRSDNDTVAQVDSEGNVTARAKGTAKIAVTEAESANYLGQTATFGVTVDLKDALALHADPVTVDFGATKQKLSVSGGNGGTYLYKSLDESVVKVSATGELTFVKAGTTRITVSQAATENTAASQPIDVAVTVNKIVGVALEVSPMKLKVGDKSGVTASGGNGGQGGKLTYRSDNDTVAQVDSEGNVTARAKGTAKIAVTEAESANYLGQTATFGVTVDLKDALALYAEPVTVDFGATKQKLSVSGGNGGTYLYKSLDESVVKVSTTGELTFVKAGTTRITVSQPATENTAASQPIDVAITVNKIVGVALEVSPMKLKVGDKSGVTASGGNGGQGGKLTYRSDNDTVAQVDSEGNVTARAKGTAKIAVTEAESANYLGQTATFGVTVDLKDALALHADPVTVDFGATKQKLSVSGGNGGIYLYRSSDVSIVKVSDKGEIEFIEVGTTDINVSQAATSTTAAPISIDVPVTVKHGKPVIKDLNITGQSVIGSTLKSSYKYVGNGVAEAEEKASYQWMNEKEWITGATSKDYVITLADVGHEIHVQAITRNRLGESSSLVISNKIKVIPLPSISNQRIWGSPIEGQTLDALYTLENGDAEQTKKTITWERTSGSNPGIIPGATKQQYVLTANDVGAKVRFHVTPTNSSGLKGELASAPSFGPVIALPSISNLSISGTPRVGETLSANYTLQNGDAGKTEKTMTWERTSGSNPGTIPGATLRKYTLTKDDIGAEIRFHVTATNSSGLTGGSSSAPGVGPVVGMPNVDRLNISGIFIVGQQLRANYSLEDGDDAKTLKTITWYINGTVVAEGTRYYRLVADDIGGNINFRVTAISSDNTKGNWSSSTTYGPIKDNKPKVSNLSVSTTSCGFSQREYTAHYDYDAQGGSAEGDTVITWTSSTKTAHGRTVCVSVYNSNGFDKLTITPKNKDGIVGDVVEKSI
ncbi:inverse autotransporter beta domain-containing protein [Rouxiella sp. S1S-2]|uniref:inverse autotransporter beta domain-containing protein n=1 Tax=Rouxiella sp. S1S-2 TaxID=2653856 RepID=UPI00186AD7AF|nr:inverse autotransporter beta domain-containing protein [Rouxiella sp. S1S-2]